MERNDRLEARRRRSLPLLISVCLNATRACERSSWCGGPDDLFTLIKVFVAMDDSGPCASIFKGMRERPLFPYEV